MVIQTRFGYACLVNDLINAGQVVPLFVKQTGGGLDNVLLYGDFLCFHPAKEWLMAHADKSVYIIFTSGVNWI
jgi:hypothetical protein